MRASSTARMTPSQFIQHMNARHAQAGELADLSHLDLRSARRPKDRATWEAYHRRLHDYREYAHEHSEA